MTWWGWVLLWLALFAGAAVVFAVLGLGLWRKTRALLAELGRAERELSAVAPRTTDPW